MLRGGIFLVLFVLLASPALAQRVTKVVCLGDSVTKGVRDGVKPDETFCVLLEKGLRKATLRNIPVINAGIGGHTTADGLARFDADVLAQKPSHVVIMFGINDSWIDAGKMASRVTAADFAANLQKMVERLKQQKITVILMTANPVVAPKYPPERNANLKKYVEAMRDVARKEQVPLVDVYARFAELALEGVDLNKLYTDAMHPNPKGHALIAEMLLQELEAVPKK